MSVAPLRFTDQGGIDKLMLIEVPDALLGALTTGDVLYLRGQENEDAMVCTSDTSFILRQTETSHTCFLVPHLQPQPADAAAAAGTAAAPTETVSSTDGYPANHIAGLVTCHYDLLPAPARTGALRALFRGGPLTRQHDAQLAALADAVLAARATAAPDAPLGVTDSDIDSLLGFPDSLAASQAAKRPRLAATDSSSSSASAAATVALSLTASVAAVSSGGLPALTGRTLRDLGHLVQASDSALRAAVAAVPLLRVGRAFCAVARDLTSDIVDGVLNVIGSLALDPARVSTETLLAELRADGVCSLFTAAHTLYALADWPATDALNAEPQPLTLQTPAHVDAVDAVAASAAAATADAEAARQQQRYEQRLSHWRSVQAEPTPLGSAAAALARHSHADGDAPLPAGIVPGTAAADATAFAPSLRLPRRLALSTTKLARHRAETVLRSQKQVPAKQFLAEWAESLPTSVKPNPSMLAGLALCVNTVALHASKTEKVLTGGSGADKDDVYVLYDIEALSAETEPRFRELFTYRPFWRIEEIKPYVAELAPPGVSLDQLLLRNARAVRAPQGETDAAGKPLMVYTWR